MLAAAFAGVGVLGVAACTGVPPATTTTTTTTTVPPGPTPGCYVDAPEAPNYTDIVYVGPIDTRGNTVYDDGCDGGGSGLVTTIVVAGSAVEADSKCQALTGSGANESPYQTFFPGLPADVWKCVENYTA